MTLQIPACRDTGSSSVTTAGQPQLADHGFHIAADHFATHNFSIIATWVFFFYLFFHYYLVLSTESIIKTSTQSTPPGLYANLVHGVSTLDRLCYIEQHHQAAMFSRDATYTRTG